jgi:hypothetical protein
VPAFLMLLIVRERSTPLFLIEISWLGERAHVETLLIDGPAPESCNA